MTMEAVQVLHMNGGMGETSYAKNSLLQQKVITMTKPITEQAITNLYRSITTPTSTLAIADLGCSSGPNTLFLISELINSIQNLSKEEHHRQAPDFQVFLNDLPGNDFNAIFRSLWSVQLDKSSSSSSSSPSSSLFINGVPGSFYGRLFPAKTLHFVHSSYSLQWLSRVPEGVREGNKGSIYMSGRSPKSVVEAYYEQFRTDFGAFLRCRSVEIVRGGRMVLTLLGRKSPVPTSKECCYIWELMSLALNHMASQGLIDEEKVNSFNIPQYTPSPMEVEAEVKKEGSFSIDRLEVSRVSWDAYEGGEDKKFIDAGENVAKCMRAVAEPLLISHFGAGEVIDEVFRRYKAIVSDRMATEKTEFVNVVVSLVNS